MSIRTDMAAESFSQAGGAEKLQGVKVKNKVIENARLEVTDITIETQEAAEKLGRPVGRYITLTATDSTFDMYSDSFSERAEIIAKAIGELCGGCERFLAVGLGNYALTSDAVGPLTAEKIFATRHIKSLAKEIDTDDLGEVTVIQPGVLGNTGIESSEQVKAIAERVAPQAIIAVDALACSELSNLGRTIQLCNHRHFSGERSRKRTKRAFVFDPRGKVHCHRRANGHRPLHCRTAHFRSGRT